MFYDPKGKIGFPYSNVVLSVDTWVYFFFEHLIIVLLALVIWELEPTYRTAVTVFLWLAIVDMMDYILFYGEPWLPYFPTWNIIKNILFGMAVVYEGTKQK